MARIVFMTSLKEKHQRHIDNHKVKNKELIETDKNRLNLETSERIQKPPKEHYASHFYPGQVDNIPGN